MVPPVWGRAVQASDGEHSTVTMVGGGGGSCVKWGGPWGALCRSPGKLGSQGRWKVASEGGKGHRGFRKWVGVSLCHVLGSAGV